jgi:LEA14-like dessication related protein
VGRPRLVRDNVRRTSCISRWPHFAWAGLLVLLSACATPRNPTVTPQVVRVVAVSFRGLDLDVELRVDNPNTYALAVQEVTGLLFLGDGQRLGRSSSKPQHSIPPRGSSIVQSRLHVDWENLSALTPFMAAEAVPYTFRGNVALGNETFNITLPFTLEGQLTRAQLLQAGLRGL